MSSVRVALDTGRLILTADQDHIYQPFKAMLAATWDQDRGAIVLPATVGAMEELTTIIGGLRSQGVTATRSADTNELLQAMQAAANARLKRFEEDLPDFPGTMPAWIHQRQAFWFAEPQFGVCLAMDMGTGKTKVTVGLLDHWETDLVLVLCPKSVVGVWPREFDKHSLRTWYPWAGQVQGARGPLKNPSVSKRAAAADLHAEQHQIAGTPAAIVCNYDSCWQPAMEKVLLKLARSGRIKVMVLDESHRVKAPNGKASRFCFRLSRAIEARGGRVLELTGTPFSHSPLDVFGQYRCLDPAYFGTNHARFKRRYAIEAPLPTGRATMIVGMQPETEGELKERFHKLAYVCNKRDLVARGVLHIPPATEDFRECTLGQKATDLYQALEEEFVAELDNGTVTVANAMVKLLRLQQITSGHVPLDDAGDGAPIADQATVDALAAMGLAAPGGNDGPARKRTGRVVEVDTAKRDLLADTLTDIPTSDPVIVFCRFRHDLDMVAHVAKTQGRNYAELSGRRRDALAPDSTLAEHVQLAGVQIQSGGVGIDFTQACLGIYFSIGHALGDYEQSLARLDRPGQMMPTTFLHLVARLSTGAWSADRRVYQALYRRLDIIKSVMKAPGAWDTDL
jgi:SNF2 family DNA or RNA helicase